MKQLMQPTKTLETLHDQMVIESMEFGDLRARVGRTLGLDRILNEQFAASYERMDRFLDELQVLNALEGVVEVESVGA